MTRSNWFIEVAVLIARLLLLNCQLFAQETIGKPGSPSDTTTISGQLPPPDPKFGSVIK